MNGAVKKGPLRAEAIFARKDLFWKILENQGCLDYFQTHIHGQSLKVVDCSNNNAPDRL